ncbi:MAG: hypothetical protein PHU46_02800 [Rhodocyclaceae bacterium]|nr:hypothetical protein [Rhodocyclaceae bacterium]
MSITSALRLTLSALAALFLSHAQGANMSKYFQGPDALLDGAIQADDRSAIARAIASGANPNARGIHDVTPLMLAVDRLKPQAVAELLARGADPNARAGDGNGPVSLAVENYRNAPEIMFAVIRGGGNPDTRRPDDDPVIMRFVNDRNCEFIRHMKALGANLDITSRMGDPIISDAAIGADWDVVWCLIELGARYDYEGKVRDPLSKSFFDDFPAPDSPIFPYKKKVWQFLKEHGIAVPPLKE